jgi:thioesterase domain-containing protein
MATALQAAGEEVGLVAALDAYPVPWTGEVVPETSQDILRQLLQFLGHDAAGFGDGPLAHAEVMAALASGGSSLAALTEAHVAALAEVGTNIARLTGSLDLGRLAGDLVLFPATEGKEGSGLTPALWDPYVEGRVRTHPIRCVHNDLLSPGPLAEVGRVLSDRLRHSADRHSVRKDEK